MTELRQKLQDRLADNFFGFDANTILNSDDMTRDVKQSVEANFVASLQRVVSYLDRRVPRIFVRGDTTMEGPKVPSEARRREAPERRGG